MIRTPKEWNETCETCHGRGIVHKVERFVLLTPDEQEKTFGDKVSLDEKHDIPPNSVTCWVSTGASIFEACKEGVQLANMLSRPVVFEFNGDVAVCYENSDPIMRAKTWWKKAYGKTYEESMKDR